LAAAAPAPRRRAAGDIPELARSGSQPGNVGRPRTSINRRTACTIIADALEHLAQYRPAAEITDVVDLIDQAVECGWQGVR
jgi:hypothetical protein